MSNGPTETIAVKRSELISLHAGLSHLASSLSNLPETPMFMGGPTTHGALKTILEWVEHKLGETKG